VDFNRLFEGEKKYATCAAIGIIVILIGGLTCLYFRATSPVGTYGFVYYLGRGVCYVGSTLVVSTLIVGGLLEKRFNQYIRLGMLLAAGWITAYMIAIMS
jgi:hypothetical protein